MVEHEQDDLVTLPIEWYVPTEVPGRYATNLVVQHTEHEFVISFFEALPPIAFGSPEETRAQLEKLGTVRLECVARVIVSPRRMTEFVKVLQHNLDNYLAKQQDEGE